MARMRYLKPGFFTNELLVEHSPWHRLLFAGLWTIADRAGRLEDRPKRIKAELFAYDDEVTGERVDAMLTDLARGDDPFLVRYEVDGVRVIQITKWTANQKPHANEAESRLPPMDHAARKMDRTRENTEQSEGFAPKSEPSTTISRAEHHHFASGSDLYGERRTGNGERRTGTGNGEPAADAPAAPAPPLPPGRVEPLGPSSSPVVVPLAPASSAMGGPDRLIDGRWQRQHGSHAAFPGPCLVGACVLPQLHQEFTAALSVSEGRGPDGRTLAEFYRDETGAIEASGRPVSDTWAHWRAAFRRWIPPAPATLTRGQRALAAAHAVGQALEAGAELDPFGTKAAERELHQHAARATDADRVGSAPAAPVVARVAAGRPS